MKGPLLIALALLFCAVVLTLLLVEADRPASPTLGAVRPVQAEPQELPPEPLVPAPTERAGTRPTTDVRTSVDAGERTPPRATRELESGPPIRMTFNGAILSREGPIQGAQILAMHGEFALLEAQADGEGRFSLFFDRPVADARLRVQARGFAPLEIELEVPARSGSRFLGNLILQKGVHLRGLVRVPDGGPAVGASVHVRSLASGRGANLFTQTQATQADGTFHFPAAPLGQVHVRVVAAGFGEVDRQFNLTHDYTIELQLAPARDFSVRLSLEDGQPVSGVMVRIAPAGRPAQGREEQTGRAGRADFADLGDSLWLVQVNSPEYRPLTRSNVEADGSELELVLQPWPCIVGRLLTPDGEPVAAGATIEVQPSSRRGDLVRVDVQATRHAVGEKGRFRVCGVRPGTYVLRARAPGFAASDSDPIRVGPSEDTYAGPVFLQLGGALELRATDGSGPLAGAEVEIYAAPPPAALIWLPDAAQLRAPLATARSGPGGEVRLDNLTPGQVWALVRAEGRLPRLRGPLVVVARKTNDLGDLELRPGGTIHGRVLDPQGSGVSGAMVLLLANEEVPTTIHLTTAADGSYRSPAVPGGTWHLRVRSASDSQRGSHTKTVQTQLEAGGEARVDFQL